MSFSEEIRATGNFQRQFQKEKRRIQLSEIPKTDIDTLQTHVIDIRTQIHFADIANHEGHQPEPIGPHQYILEPDYKSVKLRSKFKDTFGTGEYTSQSHTVLGNLNIYNAIRMYDQAGVSGQKLWYYILAESPDPPNTEHFFENLWHWDVGEGALALNILSADQTHFMRVEASMSTHYDFTSTNFSVCFWIRPSLVTGGTDDFIAYRYQDSSNSWSIQIDTDDSKLWADMEVGGVHFKKQYDTPLVVDNWYFVVLSWDAVGQVLYLTVNGTAGITSSKATNTQTTINGLFFGGFPDASSAEVYRGLFTWVTYYKHQPSIVFDGNDNVNCGNHASLWSQALSKFSFCYWVYPQGDWLGTRDHIRHGPSGAGRFRVETNAGVTGENRWRIRNNADTADVEAKISNMTLNEWQLITCTYDNSLATANLKMYRNGTLGGTTGNHTETIASLSADMLLGGELIGYMQGFQWWTTKCLSPKEVNDIWKLRYTGPEPDYWVPMLDGDISTNAARTQDIIDPLKNKYATFSGNATWAVGKGRILSTEEVTNLESFNTITPTRKPLIHGRGQYGYSPMSWNFDGVDDNINLGDHPDLWSQGLNKFSFSFWMYPTAAWDGANNFLCVRHGNGNHGFECDLDFSVVGQIYFQVRNSVSTPFEANNGTGGERVTLFNWNFITCVYDNSLGSANVKIYVNGVLGSNTANLTEVINAPATTMEWGGPSTDFQGQMQDFRWWTNVALSQSDVTELYNGGTDHPQMDFWLPTNEGVGTTVIDKIGGKTVSDSQIQWHANHH